MFSFCLGLAILRAITGDQNLIEVHSRATEADI
jgi:hypothetical protein